MNRIIELLKIELFSFLYFLLYILPGYYFSNKLRGYFISFHLKKSGKKLLINREVIIESPHNISIGDNFLINARCWISGGGGLNIGNNVLIGPNVVIHTSNHNFQYKSITINKQGHTLKPVIIEDDVWIGANCMITPGVILAQGCVIGAGSVVTKDTEPYGVYVGVPAKKIKERE